MSADPSTGVFRHATVVVVGEAGVLIRGPSGSGKSALALALLAEADRRGLFARLVGDDRVEISTSGGRVTARGHPAVSGLIEERGTGLLPVPFEGAAVVRCVVDMIAKSQNMSQSRLPEPHERRGTVAGVDLPRLAICGALGAQEGARRVLALLATEGS